MTPNPSDTAYIQMNPNCINEHAIRARGEIFRRIDEIAKEMGTIANNTEDGAVPRKLNAGEWYQNVVSIIGERGSGKTVLLLSACVCLGEDKIKSRHRHENNTQNEYEKICQKVEGDILLPIIQPEFFGPEDTLITWILAYLKEHVEDKGNESRFMKIQHEDDDDDGDIRPSEFIDKMRCAEALFSRKFASNLAEQDVTADDFQQETLAVVDAHHHFSRDWRKLVNALIIKESKHKTATDRKERPFLIIPIDDADLNPAALPVILQQMQILQHPNVLFIFSVHQKSLRSMMYMSQLELNTNRAETPPVVNFENLIKHKLRAVEDVRADAWNRIEKCLPRKYRVELQPLSTKERLDFKPLIDIDGQGNDSDSRTFLKLLEAIRLNIFGNKRSKSIAPLFDLAQSFDRCPLPDRCAKECLIKVPDEFKKYCQFNKRDDLDDNCTKSFCSVCKNSQDINDTEKNDTEKIEIGEPTGCWNSTIRKMHETYKGTITAQDKNNGEIDKLNKELGILVPPIPSFYVDALPKYPRAMGQVYHILHRWVSDIEAARKKKDDSGRSYDDMCAELKKLTNENGKNEDVQKLTKEISTIEKELELHQKTAQGVKALLVACAESIPSLPRAFYQRIEFIDNPNLGSKHPIQINFDAKGLTNLINADGGGIVVDVSTVGRSSRVLSVYPIADHMMLIPRRINDIYGSFYDEKKDPYEIPCEWSYKESKEEGRQRKVTVSGEKEYYTRVTDLYRVPDEYFALYNLAYDLTNSTGVFGRTSNSNEYQMRDGTPVSIFSVQTRTSTQFSDCYCAMPRWHRMADYNLFALAWNHLVRQIADIVERLGSTIGEHNLADWIVLSLIRIHICLEMNYAPFIVSNTEKELVIKYLTRDANARETEKNDLLNPIKQFVKRGLQSAMEHIKQESRSRALPKHHQAFKAWVEYGLPMLSTGDYVSPELGGWIAYQWIMLLITNDDSIDDDSGDGCTCEKAYSGCQQQAEHAIRRKYGIPAQVDLREFLSQIMRFDDLQTGNGDTQLQRDCESCALVRHAFIYAMLKGKFTKHREDVLKYNHPSAYFWKEYLPEEGKEFHTDKGSTYALLIQLVTIFDLRSNGGGEIKGYKDEWKASDDGQPSKKWLIQMKKSEAKMKESHETENEQASDALESSSP